MTTGNLLAYILSTGNMKPYNITANPLCLYNLVTRSGFKYKIATIPRFGIHFGYKVPDCQTILIFKYNTNTIQIRDRFARLYYQNGSVLSAR